ncbi:MAG: YhbY family RNA-binding protein [Betaproteobacteria bacterium]|nr:YhbY family RNA-binding protein [Betaproteobacteria bacterium]
MTIELTPARRRALRARAHGLHPVASISQNGLSASVLAEIDRGLKAHELIKVRVYGAERTEREALLAEVCARLEAAPVQHIGNVLVVFRENPESEKPAAPPARKARSAAKTSNPRRRLRK